MKYRVDEGCAWWTLGAQKGIAQPPYVVRHRGRWYRTRPENDLSLVEQNALAAMERLDYGERRCLDYLNRMRKNFNDLPFWTYKADAIALPTGRDRA